MQSKLCFPLLPLIFHLKLLSQGSVWLIKLKCVMHGTIQITFIIPTGISVLMIITIFNGYCQSGLKTKDPFNFFTLSLCKKPVYIFIWINNTHMFILVHYYQLEIWLKPYFNEINLQMARVWCLKISKHCSFSILPVFLNHQHFSSCY